MALAILRQPRTDATHDPQPCCGAARAGQRQAPGPLWKALALRSPAAGCHCKSTVRGRGSASIPVTQPSDAVERDADRIGNRVLERPLPPRTFRDGPPRPEPPPGSVPSGGHPLEPGTRALFEERFGAAFGSVRVHTDTPAAQAAAGLDAAAYAVGEHLVFGAGQYRPQSPDGRRLLAHELAHVAQEREAGGPPTLRRWVTVQNPGASPTHGSFGGLTRAEIFAGWLNTLCPSGRFRVEASSGNVDVDNQSICLDQVFDPARAAQDPNPTSCACACDAWGDLGEGRVDLFIEPQIPLPARIAGSTPDRSLAPFGGAVTITATSAQAANFVVTRPTIVMTGTGNVSLAGAGDPHSSAPGSVSTPPWLVFAHEYCGHVHERPNAPNEHLQTPEGTRSAVDVENLIRREHGFGTRRGAFVSGGRASVWRLQPADTLATLEARFGVVLRGSAAWDLSGDPVFPRNLSNKIAGENGEVRRSDLPARNRDAFLDQTSAEMLDHARRNEGGEIVIAGIAWDDVRAGDTWASIARRWRVGARAGATGAQRVERANQGLPGLVPGGRVVIPR